jgi:pilus assembly protein Flp/PilA
MIVIQIITRFLSAWQGDNRGASAIEYTLIAGGIALALVAAIFAFGGSLSSMFTNLGSSMQAAVGH